MNKIKLLLNESIATVQIKLKLRTFVSLNIFRMQRIRCKQKKYRAGRKSSDESSGPDGAGMSGGGLSPLGGA